MDADLAPGSLQAWLRLLSGLAIFIAPGLAMADRVFRQRIHLLTAPVFSFSLLALAAIALDFGLGVPIHIVTSHLIAIALTAWLGWPRVVQAWRWMSGGTGSVARASGRGANAWQQRAHHELVPDIDGDVAGGGDVGAGVVERQAARRSGERLRPGTWRWRPAWGLVLILPFLVLVHGLQHVPGDSVEDDPAGPWDVYPSLLRHAVDALQGDQYPYPIHVDEHIHIAYMAQIDREGSADIDDPYTQVPQQRDLFSVQGMRSERGFDVAMVQFSHLTGMGLAAMARWLPAIWAGFLGLTMYLVLRPAPGAVAAAALVAVLPTDVRFLGVGYLIPSPFALPWILLTLLVAQRASGAPRFFSLLLLLTAAHFMHLVIGVLSILAAVTGTLLRGDARGRRGGMLVAALLPLVWILPTTLRDAQDAVASEHTLPFNVGFLGIPGIALYGLAVVGTALAWLWPKRRNEPHRAMSLMVIPMTISLLLSIRYQHANDATYSRQVFAFMLMLVGLASYGLAEGLRRLMVATWVARHRWAPGLRHGLVAVAVLVVLVPPLGSHMVYEPYRVHGPASWDAAQVLAHSGVGPADVFLSHPWEAPVYNSLTGAVPHTVLRPGAPAERGSDWDFYVQSGGASAAWLEARDITVVVAAVPPNAPHDVLGTNVYRIR